MDRIKLLKALADDTRLKILDELRQGEKCACSLPSKIGKAQSTVSGHLKVLEDTGILESNQKGTYRWYRIKNLKVKKILEMMDIEK